MRGGIAEYAPVAAGFDTSTALSVTAVRDQEKQGFQERSMYYGVLLAMKMVFNPAQSVQNNHEYSQGPVKEHLLVKLATFECVVEYELGTKKRLIVK